MTKRTLFACAATCAACGQAASPDLDGTFLVSTAWCSSSYDKSTGYSSSRRLVFREDGTYTSASRSERRSSGPAGSAASSSAASSTGQWKLERGELFLTEGGGFERVQTAVKRVDARPVLVTDGVQYMACK